MKRPSWSYSGLGLETPSTEHLEAASNPHPCSSASEIFSGNRFLLSVPLQSGKRDNANTDGFWSALRSAMSDLITQSTRVLRGARQLLGAPTEPGHVIENPARQNCRPQTARRQHTARRQSILDPQLRQSENRRTVIACVICHRHHPRETRMVGCCSRRGLVFFGLE